MFATFSTERLAGDKSIWEKMSKRNLLTFKSSSKTIKVKLKDKIIQLKEERNLMTRFIIPSRMREEIDLPALLRKYEFSVVPRSMFSSDGRLLHCTDKSNVINAVENLMKSRQPQEQDRSGSDEESSLDESTETRKVIILDGMAIVQKLKKTKDTKTCRDLGEVFIKRVKLESRQYDEVYLIFDRYIEGSLKERTRHKRTGGKGIQYKVTDNARIDNIPLKKFLSHIETKQELTVYLARLLVNYFEENNTNYVVVYDTVCETNIDGFEEALKEHSQEEAATLMVLYALEIAERDPFSKVCVVSPDTDVFLLFISMFPRLCKDIIFKTGSGDNLREIDIDAAYEALDPKHSSAILGFHAFTGCDQTGKFYGKTKAFCWKTLIESSDEELAALQKLGESEELPTEDMILGLEAFTMRLYRQNVPHSVKSLSDMRWYLFSKKQSEAEKLPPTKAALKYKILRAHHVTMMCKTSDRPNPELPDPCSFGWQNVDGIVQPVLTDELPAPEASIEMCMCKCNKTRCSTNYCICFKNDLVCTEMCLCKQCENDGQMDNGQFGESDDEIFD